MIRLSSQSSGEAYNRRSYIGLKIGGGQKWTSELNDQLDIFGFIYMVLESRDYVFKMSIFKKPAGPLPGLAGSPACPPAILPVSRLLGLSSINIVG